VSSVQTSTSIRLEIQKIKELPSLPVIAQQLLAAVNDDDTSIDEIAAIIQRDPILTSRILGLANSAFFGFRRKVYKLTDAIVNILGLDLVRALGLTMVMGGAFDVHKCKPFDIVRHWSSAFMTAELSMRLLSLVEGDEEMHESQLFLYGLLHNFGILILVDRFPQLMTDIFVIAKKHPERRLIYTEQALLDMDHHQAGSWLAEKWQLPSDVSRVIERHHYPDYRGEFWQAALLVGFSSRMSRNWILGADILVPDEPEVIDALKMDRGKLTKIAEQCREKLEDISNIAKEMSD
jgi:HD-like signal output (HDOD) protein